LEFIFLASTQVLRRKGKEVPPMAKKGQTEVGY